MVSAEDIEAIVKAGTYAPTGRGKQSPIIIAVTNKDNWSEYSDEQDYISNELAFEMENLGI